MSKKPILYGALFIAGYVTHTVLEKIEYSDVLPYTVIQKEDSLYISGPDGDKIITATGEVGSVYQRMQGLLLEDKLDLDHALKKLQRSKLADSTPSIH